MTILTNMKKFERLHNLIITGNTGTPEQVARKLGISRASLYILIDAMKELGLTPEYSRKYQTFYYEKEMKLSLVFKVEEITNSEDLININAGSFSFLLPSKFLDGTNLSLHSYLREYKESVHRL